MSSFPSIAVEGMTRFLTAKFSVPMSTNLTTGVMGFMQGVEPVFLDVTFGLLQLPMYVVTPPPSFFTFPSIEPGGLGENWFNKIHIIPRTLALGNILTTIDRTIDIYNAYLYETHELQAFINNAGAGTSIIDMPLLPFTLQPQESLLLTLEVTPDGAPTINTTLDFQIDLPYLLSVPITGTRIVMFPFEPEAPVTERLLFLTDVIQAIDATEQRISLRLAPRQEFDLTLKREDGVERQKVDFLLFDWQSRVFGVPVWTEPSFLTTAAIAGDATVQVNTTTLGDFRADGLAIVYVDENTFDAAEVDSVGSTSIVFKSPILGSYPVGTRVMPLRACMTTQPAKERKHPVNLAEFDVTMRVLDNEVDLSDLSGWPTYDGKVLLSDPNAIDTTLDGDIERQVTVFDGGTGKLSQASTWDRARHGSAKTFIMRSRTALWSVRKLLHGLRGRQVSFYLPTFTKDLTLFALYLSGSASMSIVNVGYSRYAINRSPKNVLHIILNNGTSIVRTITASSEVNAAEEHITLNTSISQDIAVSDIARIEFYEKVRIDNDTITIVHQDSNGTAKCGFPVIVVLD